MLALVVVIFALCWLPYRYFSHVSLSLSLELLEYDYMLIFKMLYGNTF